LEDAVKVANDLGEKLLVWGLIEDKEYASKIENTFTNEIVEWKGFLPTKKFQEQLGRCRALINTPNGMKPTAMLLLKQWLVVSL